MENPFKYARCINNNGMEFSLRLGNIYQIIDDPKAEAVDMLRVVDEDGEDYLHSKSRFTLLIENKTT